MTRKISKSKLKIKMDILWGDIIKARADNKCAIQVEHRLSYRCNAHHIVGKGCTYLRWDLRNGICLCTHHHRFGNPNAHDNGATWFRDWLVNNRLEDYEYVKSLEHRTMSSIPLQWYLDKYEMLKEMEI